MSFPRLRGSARYFPLLPLHSQAKEAETPKTRASTRSSPTKLGILPNVERLVLPFEIATIRTRIDWLFAQVLVVPFKVTVEVVEVELRPLLLVDVKGRVLQPHAHGFMRPPAVEDLCREDASNVPEDRIRL